MQPAGALRDHVCVEVPETRNAKTPDGVHLAYHVVGDGPVDVLWLHTFPRRIGGAVGARPHSRAYGKTQLVRARIRYDMRATRLSDRHPPLPDLETQVRDLLAVLDVVGSWSTVIVSAGSPAGPLFAATHPRRTRALCYFDPGARGRVRSEDYPFATFDGPVRALRCARGIMEAVRDLGIQIRAGVHAGECQMIDGKASGIGVAIGARVCATARPSEILLSQTVKDIIAGSGLTLEDRGSHELKGVPGAWHLYAVSSL